ncbi:MAG: hypothetical protein P8182_18030 [Deltaproteobacteria bacterium]
MSTSLMYHALNIVAYRHRKTEYVGSEIRFTVEQQFDKIKLFGNRRGHQGCQPSELRAFTSAS